MRRSLVVAGLVVGVTILGGAGWAIVSTVVNEPSRVSTAELRELPPIGLVWANRGRAQATAAGDVYVVRADARAARRVWRSKSPYDASGALISGVYGAYDAAWSPSGGRIALELAVWTDDPNSRVAVVNSDGRQMRHVSKLELSGLHLSTVWSGDGRVLVYSYYGDIWTYAPEVGRRTRIWRTPRAAGGESISALDVSADGRRIVAEYRRSGRVTKRGLVTMSLDGDGVVELMRAERDTEWLGLDPRWSPDGRSIAFIRRGNVYVINADGRGLRRLTRSVGAVQPPFWSPDSRSILFTRDTRHAVSRDALSEVFVVGTDGLRGARMVASSDGSSRAVGWSPDGHMILFLRDTWDDDKPKDWWSELWIMDADGGRQTRLPFNRPGWTVLKVDVS